MKTVYGFDTMPHRLFSLYLIEQIKKNQELNILLERAYISDNFGCYNRKGGEVKGGQILYKERDKVTSGELVMMCCDVAGMGNLNILIGELAVNLAVREILATVKNWYGVWLISQLNSGDEFIFLIDRKNTRIVDEIDIMFKVCGFGGVCGAIADIEIELGYTCNANLIMEKVYKLKRQKLNGSTS